MLGCLPVASSKASREELLEEDAAAWNRPPNPRRRTDGGLKGKCRMKGNEGVIARVCFPHVFRSVKPFICSVVGTWEVDAEL